MNDDRSTPALIGDLLTQTTDLFRKEVQLFRSEIGEKSHQIAIACGLIVAAVVVALVALNVLAAALVGALANAIGAAWAALVVGGALAIVAFVLVGKGVNDLKASNLAPDRTANAVSKDASMAKEKLS